MNCVDRVVFLLFTMCLSGQHQAIKSDSCMNYTAFYRRKTLAFWAWISSALWCPPWKSFMQISSTQAVNMIRMNSSFCFYSYKRLFLCFICLAVFFFFFCYHHNPLFKKLYEKVPISCKTRLVGQLNNFVSVTVSLKMAGWIKGLSYSTLIYSRDTEIQLDCLIDTEISIRQKTRTTWRELFCCNRLFWDG